MSPKPTVGRGRCELALLDSVDAINQQIIACRLCERLVSWREQVAREKRAAFRNETYWGRPVAGFGDPRARVLICGLAPAAHGGNRTGRVFTGDRSGDWLFDALHAVGFANQPTSICRDDGLALAGCYITACVRCAPPGNKPTINERDTCLPFLLAELRLLREVRVIVCLGGFAWDGVLRCLRDLGIDEARRTAFGHATEAVIGRYTMVGCYHPSQQNTFTGRLTREMLISVLRRARALATSRPRKSMPRLSKHS
jgi:uracil-DNA glycosylase family 4